MRKWCCLTETEKKMVFPGEWIRKKMKRLERVCVTVIEERKGKKIKKVKKDPKKEKMSYCF